MSNIYFMGGRKTRKDKGRKRLKRGLKLAAGAGVVGGLAAAGLAVRNRQFAYKQGPDQGRLSPASTQARLMPSTPRRVNTTAATPSMGVITPKQSPNYRMEDLDVGMQSFVTTQRALGKAVQVKRASDYLGKLVNRQSKRNDKKN